ncbi:MAG TPA: hypothetical protein DEP72_03725 [Clostridiales bacterium]|nr:MAG: hypothetical protein A2Y18_05345 [Clostridiales bacterium GWD2_32_19]HCC07263.1 hypothetical protein [Clostridiales bacterium]
MKKSKMEKVIETIIRSGYQNISAKAQQEERVLFEKLANKGLSNSGEAIQSRISLWTGSISTGTKAIIEKLIKNLIETNRSKYSIKEIKFIEEMIQNHLTGFKESIPRRIKERDPDVNESQLEIIMNSGVFFKDSYLREFIDVNNAKLTTVKDILKTYDVYQAFLSFLLVGITYLTVYMESFMRFKIYNIPEHLININANNFLYPVTIIVIILFILIPCVYSFGSFALIQVTEEKKGGFNPKTRWAMYIITILLVTVFWGIINTNYKKFYPIEINIDGVILDLFPVIISLFIFILFLGIVGKIFEFLINNKFSIFNIIKTLMKNILLDSPLTKVLFTYFLILAVVILCFMFEKNSIENNEEYLTMIYKSEMMIVISEYNGNYIAKHLYYDKNTGTISFENDYVVADPKDVDNIQKLRVGKIQNNSMNVKKFEINNETIKYLK